jgi:hypothetical protein
MKLSNLIEQADTIYRLSLSQGEKQELQRRLVSAGYDKSIAPGRTSQLVDDVLQTTDHIRQRPQLATATTSLYSGMKVEAAPAHDGCPRCQQPMKRVALLSERQADYCQGCAITLPLKA